MHRHNFYASEGNVTLCYYSSACQMDIHGKIREVLAETVRDDQSSARQSLSQGDFLRALQRRGVIDDMMKDLHFTQVEQLFGCIFRAIYIIIFDTEVFLNQSIQNSNFLLVHLITIYCFHSLPSAWIKSIFDPGCQFCPHLF